MMFKLIKTALGFVGGASSVYSLLGGIALALGAGYYYYYQIVTKPIGIERDKVVQCQKDLDDTVSIYDKNIIALGTTLNKQTQTIYDLNESIKDIKYKDAQRLMECETKLDEMNWRTEIEKVNTDDTFFYTELPF